MKIFCIILPHNFSVGPRQYIAFLLVGLVHSECAVSLCSGMPSHFGLLLNTQYRKNRYSPKTGRHHDPVIILSPIGGFAFAGIGLQDVEIE